MKGNSKPKRFMLNTLELQRLQFLHRLVTLCTGGKCCQACCSQACSSASQEREPAQAQAPGCAGQLSPPALPFVCGPVIITSVQ